MGNQTIRDKIYLRIQKLECAKPFPYRLLKGLGSSSSTQRAVRRLCEEGHLEKLMIGFYIRPKQLKSVPSITVTCGVDDLVKVWAQERGYILTTTDFEEAYRLRLQTQAPMRTQFWTNGPTRLFQLGNAKVLTRHVPDRLLRWHDLPVGRLYRALRQVPASSAKPSSFKRALSMVCPEDHDKEVAKCLLLTAREIEEWHEVIREV